MWNKFRKNLDSIKIKKFLIILSIIFISIWFILGMFMGFTTKQQAVKLCEKQYKEKYTSKKATKGNAWNVKLYDKNNGKYSVSFRKDLAKTSPNGLGGYNKSTSFYCDNLKIVPIGKFFLYCAIIIWIFLIYIRYKKKERKSI